ncbi:ribokinase [Anaerobacillus alkalilacustris]|uniref:Ribokinase n=1 Tax=Anaerobacillus alkalilacustris TaxID=393763 RepID=A0A1S2LPH8_9BACI|nr:ribokinase [Anaerobacillus alkalilacustris]OIJ14276.1 ribokinase [Anaerobacillus alkalilacustris]
MKKPLITIIGSINMDLITNTTKFPLQGETVIGGFFKMLPGGKGANQAISASRLGGQVQFIGCVGDDQFGTELKKVLHDEGIHLRVKPVTGESSGVATIILSEGDNRIIVTPGANDCVDVNYLETLKEEILKSDLVLVQFEIPLQSIKYILELCHDNEIPLIVNPAPAKKLELEEWMRAAVITPNETEATELFGELKDFRKHPIAQKLVVTQGKEGAAYLENEMFNCIPTFSVDAIDTTGAGDTFNGALAVAMTEGQSLKEAIKFANGAAALSVQKLGAQSGMPTRKELEIFLKKEGV